MKKYILISLAFFILASCASPTSTSLGNAPDFSLPSVDGSIVSLADYKDSQPVLLFFHMAVG